MRSRPAKKFPAAVMTVVACLFVMTFLLIPQTSSAQADQYRVMQARADMLYGQRGDMDKAALASEAYRELLRTKPGDVFFSIRLCKLLIWIGAQTDGDAALKWVVEARQVAKAAVDANPGNPGPVFWYGTALGLEADVRDCLDSLSLVEKSEEQVQRVMAVAPSYEYGGPYRVMGRIKMKLPGLFGGDEEKAEELLLTAVKLGPSYLLNQLYLADLYHKQGRDDEAMKLLVEVRDAPVVPGLEPECALWKQTAEEFLSQSAKRED